MIERLVAWSVDHRKLLIVLWSVASFAFAGIAVQLKLDALPDITSNQVQVLTTAPGLTPDEVELRITRPLEASLGGLPGLLDERSLSRYGLSAITLVFEDGVDILRARQLIAERLATGASRLPPSASPPELGPITGGLGEIFQFTLSSPSRTPSELLELVQFRIAPLLKSVPGVVEVNTWGGARRTMEVRGDAVRMAARGITFDELRTSLGSTVGTYPGASIEAAGHHVLLRSAFLPTSSRDLADALVKLDAKEPIRVGDVALVADGSLPRLGAATRDGRGETVYVMVQMLLGANARDVTHAARAAMSKVKEMLPADVQVDVTYDRSTLVDATLVTVAKNLLEGGLLVCIILFFTLGSIRAGLLVAVSIPAAMLGAAASMVGLGLSGNLMSLGAVDFGLLVDGAVVLIERLFHHDGQSNESWTERVKRSCSAVARPSFFAVAVILLVYVPILSLTGVDGKLFRPMAMTVVLALIFALLFTLTFIPAAAATFLNAGTIPHGTPRMVRVIEHLHSLALAKVRAHARIVAVGLAVTLALTVLIASRLGSELTPTLDEKSLVIQTTRRADLSVGGAIEQATKLERAILQVPEVLSVASRLGSPAVATDTMGLEQADIYVDIAPQSAWRPGLTRDQLLEELKERIDIATPNSDVAFTQPVQMRFNELLGGAPFDVVLNLIGEDRASLMKTAHAAVEQLHLVNGAVDARLLAPEEIGVLEVRPDPMGASVWGLSVGEVLDVARGIRQGIQVGSTFEGPLEIPVVLRLGVDAPHPSNLGEVLVPTPRKELANLDQLAAVETLSSPAVLFRRNGERRVLIGFNVRGRELGDVVTEAKQRITANVPLPEGVRTQWGGQFESLQAAQMRLAIVIPIVLLLIAGLLFLHYRSGPPILWTLSTIPYASFGGLVALAVRGMSLSISAGIGFIALWGIAVMNGTVLITEIRALEHQGVPSDEATIRAAKSRARPVSMTALVAALGFLPMALSRGTGAEVQRPLATVVIGGLIVSTMLTLLVLPVARLVVRRRSFSVAS